MGNFLFLCDGSYFILVLQLESKFPSLFRSSCSISDSHVMAETLPQGKHEFVTELQSRGEKVALVGDGINDSPALVFCELHCLCNDYLKCLSQFALCVRFRFSLCGRFNCRIGFLLINLIHRLSIFTGSSRRGYRDRSWY